MAFSMTDQQKADLEIVQRFKKDLFKRSRQERVGICMEMIDRGNLISEKNGKSECVKFVLFHELIGSNGYEKFDCITHFDFKGEYSVLEYVKGLKKRLGMD